LGAAYWTHRKGKDMAIIRRTKDGWFGGAIPAGEHPIPLHGPYFFKRTAKKTALKYLALISDKDE
jgi:hypothetical protein